MCPPPFRLRLRFRLAYGAEDLHELAANLGGGSGKAMVDGLGQAG